MHGDAEDFAKQANVAAIFLNKGKPYAAGDRLVQPELAETLKLIARDGPDTFYRGPIAEAIVAASQANGGILALEDFRRYEVVEREPVRCSYRGYDIVSAPPPSSGGTTICEILNIAAGFPLGAEGYHSAASTHHLVEAMRRAYVDRNNRLGDPAFIANPLAQLLSADYAAKLRATIEPNHATASDSLKSELDQEGNQTTHYSVIDAAGNAVGVTFTINNYFGAKVIAGKTGFFLNDEMDDFTAKPGSPNMFGLVQGSANAIAPGKRPLSSMSPTLLTRDGHVFLLLGSPGGSRIITTILQVIVNIVDYGMDVQSAVNAPRFHHQWLPDVIYAEPFTFSADTAGEARQAMGYKLHDTKRAPGAPSRRSSSAPPAPARQHRGRASTIPTWSLLVPLVPGHLYGANDARRPGGAAIGY